MQQQEKLKCITAYLDAQLPDVFGSYKEKYEDRKSTLLRWKRDLMSLKITVDACVDVLHKGAVLMERRVNKEGEREGSDRRTAPDASHAPRPTDRRGDRLFPSLTGRGR